MTNYTHQDIHDAIQNAWESDLADRVLEALRPYDGKPITTRLLKALPEVPNGWRLRREYGMTQLETWDYSRTSGASRAKHAICLLLEHTEASVPLNLAEMVRKNPAYFDARKARNHARMEAMNTKAVLDAGAAAINRIQAARAELHNAMQEWESIAGYGGPLHQDRYELETLAGLRDADGKRIGER